MPNVHTIVTTFISQMACLQADKEEAVQQAEESRSQVAAMQADMHSLRLQLAHATARPIPALPLRHTHSSHAQLLCHPLQSVLGKASRAGGQ